MAGLRLIDCLRGVLLFFVWQYFRVGTPATLISLVLGLLTLLAERALFDRSVGLEERPADRTRPHAHRG